MSAAAVITALEVIHASLGVIKLLRDMQIDIAHLVNIQQIAEAEGRDISQAELDLLATDAQQAIDRLENLP